MRRALFLLTLLLACENDPREPGPPLAGYMDSCFPNKIVCDAAAGLTCNLGPDSQSPIENQTSFCTIECDEHTDCNGHHNDWCSDRGYCQIFCVQSEDCPLTTHQCIDNTCAGPGQT